MSCQSVIVIDDKIEIDWFNRKELLSEFVSVVKTDFSIKDSMNSVIEFSESNLADFISCNTSKVRTEVISIE